MPEMGQSLCFSPVLDNSGAGDKTEGRGRDSLGDVRHGIPFPRHGILDAIRLVVLGVNRTDEQVLCEYII
jgi:hypothetical protein